MSEHAATVREALGDPETCTPDDFADSVRAGLAALDALEADLVAVRGALADAEENVRLNYEMLEKALQAGEDRVRDLAAARDALRAVRAWMAQEEEAGVFVPGIVYQIIADALAEADA